MSWPYFNWCLVFFKFTITHFTSNGIKRYIYTWKFQTDYFLIKCVALKHVKMSSVFILNSFWRRNQFHVWRSLFYGFSLNISFKFYNLLGSCSNKDRHSLPPVIGPGVVAVFVVVGTIFFNKLHIRKNVWILQFMSAFHNLKHYLKYLVPNSVVYFHNKNRGSFCFDLHWTYSLNKLIFRSKCEVSPIHNSRYLQKLSSYRVLNFNWIKQIKI